MVKLIKDVSKFLDLLGIAHSLHFSKASSYIKVDGVAKLKQIRFSDHEGRKTSRNSWEVRSDRCTQRQNNIFSHLDINLMKSLMSLKIS